MTLRGNLIQIHIRNETPALFDIPVTGSNPIKLVDHLDIRNNFSVPMFPVAFAWEIHLVDGTVWRQPKTAVQILTGRPWAVY